MEITWNFVKPWRNVDGVEMVYTYVASKRCREVIGKKLGGGGRFVFREFVVGNAYDVVADLDLHIVNLLSRALYRDLISVAISDERVQGGGCDCPGKVRYARYSPRRNLQGRPVTMNRCGSSVMVYRMHPSGMIRPRTVILNLMYIAGIDDSHLGRKYLWLGRNWHQRETLEEVSRRLAVPPSSDIFPLKPAFSFPEQESGMW